jgi:hypothetical protein
MNHQIAAFADATAAQRDIPTATPLAWDAALRGAVRERS